MNRPTRIDRFHQSVLIVATLSSSWLGMQAVHELGHVLAAFASGGTIASVELHPATISYTRLAENPSPRWVAWAGPLVGVSLPLAASVAARSVKAPLWYVIQFFAGFCLIANGAYLAFGSFAEVGDAGDLLRLNTPIALLWLFGLVTIPLGLWLWHGLGDHFGLAAGGPPSVRAGYIMLMVFIFTIAIELALN